MDFGNLVSASSAFSKSTIYIYKFSVHVILKPNFPWYLSPLGQNYIRISVFLGMEAGKRKLEEIKKGQ